MLLDVQLPDIDGFAVAAVLASRVDPPAVVLVSSRSRTDYGSRIEDCRARGYIAKAELSGDAVRRLLHSRIECHQQDRDPAGQGGGGTGYRSSFRGGTLWG